MTNTVLIKRSSAANSVPSSGNLQPGELAINYNDGNLFYKNTSNVVTVIASNKFVSVSGNVTGGNIVTTGAVSASSAVVTNSVNFVSAGNISLGNIGNIHISGGSANYVISTDGAGNLSWVAQSGGSNLDVIIDNFTGNGVATAFTLSTTPSSGNVVLVNYNGAIVSHGSYSVVGNVLTFGSPPANTASIEVSTFTGSGGGGGGASNVSIRAQAMTMSILLGG